MSAMNEQKPRFISAELRPFATDSTLIITPTREMYQIEAPPATVASILQRCDGNHALDAIVADLPNAAEMHDILQVLAQSGCLSYAAPGVDEPDWARFAVDGLQTAQARATHALLLGDERLLDLVQRTALSSRFASTIIVSNDDLPRLFAEYAAKEIVLFALREYCDAAFFRWLDQQCEVAGVRWVAFHLAQGRGWIGPAIHPGHSANYRDLLARRRAAAEDDAQFAALTSAPAGPVQLPAEAELVWMLATLFIEVERWLVGAPCQIVSVELEANPLTMEYQPYPVLPLPTHQFDSAFHISAAVDSSLLLNPRSGVVLRAVQVAHHPSIPAALTTVQTNVAQMKTIYPGWHNDAFSAGSGFGDVQAAYRAAIGEAVERYCGNYMLNCQPRLASYNELIQSDEYALDPEQLTLFSERMYTTPGCPFVPLRRDTRIYWVRGRSLTRDCAAWLPASLVYVNWQTSGYNEGALTNGTYYPGVAAGEHIEMALMSAIQELIERDITMVWWMNRHPLPAIQLPPQLEVLWEGTPSEMGQRAWAISLPNEFDIPVVAGVVEQTHERFLTIGFACRPDPVQAILKAWAEALTLQEGSRDIDDPNGLTRQSIAWGWLPVACLKPWRADRAYLDDYRSDFRDISHLMAQQQFFLDPRAIEQVRPWVDVPATLPLAAVPHVGQPSLAEYQARIEARGYEIFYMDLTTPDIALTGLSAVRVIIPGLVPNFPAAFPPTGGERVQNLPVRLGWRSTPLAEADLNYMPMPHA